MPGMYQRLGFKISSCPAMFCVTNQISSNEAVEFDCQVIYNSWWDLDHCTGTRC